MMMLSESPEWCDQSQMVDWQGEGKEMSPGPVALRQTHCSSQARDSPRKFQQQSDKIRMLAKARWGLGGQGVAIAWPRLEG